jgi:phosphopantetheinyl transferase
MEVSNLTIYPTLWGQIAVAPIPDGELLEREATEEELQSVEGISSQSRRTERLAWRLLLRSVLPTAQVEYLSSGKPEIKNSQYHHISVSHCQDFVAVAIATKPCGIDVERYDRNFERVISRYMTAEEQSLSADEHWAAVVWCAKEAMYKMAGREGIDFKRDMQIISAEQSVGFVRGRWHLVAHLFGERVELQGIPIDDDHILVFTL